MNVTITWILIVSIFYLGTCERNRKVDTVQINQGTDPNHSDRIEMVNQQIVARGVKDKTVLSAMQKVPRHEFVSSNYRDMAYHDTPLPIGYGQTISQPYIVGYMSEQLNLTKQDTVLEIGTGSGYQAAVLSEIVSNVFTIEIIPELGNQASALLKRLGYQNVCVKIGDGYQGWPTYAPFDCIILTAAPPQIPEPLLNQLKEGGRLIAPVGDEFQELVLITKVGVQLKRKRLIPVRFVPMTGKAQKK
jgi:protein-L-isoaspartate(D-aspartate) O-methyltransferase